MEQNRQYVIQNESLPAYARLLINHCNLPASILGSLTYQRHPVPLILDNVLELHQQLFDDLASVDSSQDRAIRFSDYMAASFLLNTLDEAGLNRRDDQSFPKKNDYLRLLRGWHFDPNGIEAAVLKSWVESRFGLIPRYHKGPLREIISREYQQYLSDRSQGLYNSNALESQLDLLYSYNQFEIARQQLPDNITLFRGINDFSQHEILSRDNNKATLLLNNLNSFSAERERADEFGDTVIEVSIPVSKILYQPGLLPGALKGEQEYLVIGGVHEVKIQN